MTNSLSAAAPMMQAVLLTVPMFPVHHKILREWVAARREMTDGTFKHCLHRLTALGKIVQGHAGTYFST